MGTNYYTTSNQHIGKLSCGWKFLFMYYDFINSINDLKNFLRKNEIVDEYGKHFTFEEFWEKIESRQKNIPHIGEFYLNIDNYDFLTVEFS